MPPIVHLSDHEYLTSLEPDEVTAPLKALERVFTVTDMPDCRERLRGWFQAAFSEGYAGDRWLPGNLLMLYKQVLCLMECTYLLRESYPDILYRWMGRDIEGPESLFVPPYCKEHNPEPMAWKYAPQYLAGNELRYPHLVIEPFFCFYTLSTWREELWQWLDAALSDYSICECRDAREVLMVCDHLGKLVEVAHLIWIRNWRDDHKAETT